MIRRGKPIVFLLALFLCAGLALAHSGGTDSDGGHWDSSTSTYHYHHGYKAHAHTGGVCPYDFDDQASLEFISSERKTSKKESRELDILLGLLSFAFLYVVVQITYRKK